MSLQTKSERHNPLQEQRHIVTPDPVTYFRIGLMLSSSAPQILGCHSYYGRVPKCEAVIVRVSFFLVNSAAS